MQFLYLVHVLWLDVRVESLLREHIAMEDEQVQKTTHLFCHGNVRNGKCKIRKEVQSSLPYTYTKCTVCQTCFFPWDAFFCTKNYSNDTGLTRNVYHFCEEK